MLWLQNESSDDSPWSLRLSSKLQRKKSCWHTNNHAITADDSGLLNCPNMPWKLLDPKTICQHFHKNTVVFHLLSPWQNRVTLCWLTYGSNRLAQHGCLVAKGALWPLASPSLCHIYQSLTRSYSCDVQLGFIYVTFDLITWPEQNTCTVKQSKAGNMRKSSYKYILTCSITLHTNLKYLFKHTVRPISTLYANDRF